MNGIHDLGGMHGFGAVEVEADEPVFHAPWEGRVLAINGMLIARGLYNTDAFRHGIERMAPEDYLRASYYERWRASVERLLDETGVVSGAALAARARALREAPDAVRERLRHAELAPLPQPPPATYQRPLDAPPRFAPGDRVRARNVNPAGHTRLPRYVRGRVGRVERCDGGFVFPDTNAHGAGEQPQHLYHVRFAVRELWGPDAETGASVGLDLFESYLESAPQEERPHG
ncbi:MAG: nitrile hydratase subunit beta [Myxococcota bacterium]|nr:nitrile hydratase subunit beta [Myxococcota bacterium]